MKSSEQYVEMAQKRKQGYEKKQANATKEKGLLLVYTGTGKGKSTAAFGMGLRILGHGKRLGVVQFIKGAMTTAERNFFASQKNCEFQSIGDGFTWNTQNRELDMATAARAWEVAANMIQSAQYDMIILDELNIILKYEYLPFEPTMQCILQRDPNMHIVVTGRHAKDELMQYADMVSDVRAIKHHYKEGVKAQAGIEF